MNVPSPGSSPLVSEQGLERDINRKQGRERQIAVGGSGAVCRDGARAAYLMVCLHGDNLDAEAQRGDVPCHSSSF